LKTEIKKPSSLYSESSPSSRSGIFQSVPHDIHCCDEVNLSKEY